MSYKTLDPELAWKAIEGHVNVIAPAQKKLDAFYRQFNCGRCGGTMRKEAHPNPFGDSDIPVPRSLLRCVLCGHLFDPHTGMSLTMGNPAKVKPPIPIFKIKED